MFRMKKKLRKLKESGNTVRVGLVGAGKMGKGLINQMLRIEGMLPSVVADENVEKARLAFSSAGIKSEDIIYTNSLEKAKVAMEKEKFIITEDYKLTYLLNQVQGVIDATGNAPFGAIFAKESIENHKNVIMLNVECDAVVGPILYEKARQNKVIYTGTAGDEPGAIMELADFAVGAGFKLLALGKGKNNPLNNYATEDDLMEEAREKGLYPKILTAFVDGSNTMIELTAVANATGFLPDVFGCHGITTEISNITEKFSLKEQGGILNNYNIVDFAFGIAPGVFAIVTSDSKEVNELMKYLGMGKGPNYVLYRPYHLTSLETPITVYNAIVEKEATIAPEKGQVADVVTIAKKDLKKGDTLEGIGGKSVFGKITSHRIQKENNYLPIGLITKHTRLKRDIKKDEIITYDCVELEEDHIITKLRRMQDKLGL